MSGQDLRALFCGLACEQSFCAILKFMSWEARIIANIGFLLLSCRNSMRTLSVELK